MSNLFFLNKDCCGYIHIHFLGSIQHPVGDGFNDKVMRETPIFFFFFSPQVNGHSEQQQRSKKKILGYSLSEWGFLLP